MSRLEKLGNTDLTGLYHLDPTERAHRLADLQSLLETCLQYGMEKDRLAAHTFELVCVYAVQCATPFMVGLIYGNWHWFLSDRDICMNVSCGIK